MLTILFHLDIATKRKLSKKRAAQNGEEVSIVHRHHRQHPVSLESVTQPKRDLAWLYSQQVSRCGQNGDIARSGKIYAQPPRKRPFLVSRDDFDMLLGSSLSYERSRLHFFPLADVRRPGRFALHDDRFSTQLLVHPFTLQSLLSRKERSIDDGEDDEEYTSACIGACTRRGPAGPEERRGLRAKKCHFHPGHVVTT